MSDINQMDAAILKTKKIAELREIAKAFGIKGYQNLKKAELLSTLIGENDMPAPKPPAETKKGKKVTQEAPKKRETQEKSASG